MTLRDIENIPKEFVSAADIAPYLGADPNTIRWQAQHEPERLGFPVIVTGKMVRIPKEGFLYYCRYGRPVINTDVRPETVKYYFDMAMEAVLSQALEQIPSSPARKGA